MAFTLGGKLIVPAYQPCNVPEWHVHFDKVFRLLTLPSLAMISNCVYHLHIINSSRPASFIQSRVCNGFCGQPSIETSSRILTAVPAMCSTCASHFTSVGNIVRNSIQKLGQLCTFDCFLCSRGSGPCFRALDSFFFCTTQFFHSRTLYFPKPETSFRGCWDVILPVAAASWRLEQRLGGPVFLISFKYDPRAFTCLPTSLLREAKCPPDQPASIPWYGTVFRGSIVALMRAMRGHRYRKNGCGPTHTSPPRFMSCEPRPSMWASSVASSPASSLVPHRALVTRTAFPKSWIEFTVNSHLLC